MRISSSRIDVRTFEISYLAEEFAIELRTESIPRFFRTQYLINAVIVEVESCKEGGPGTCPVLRLTEHLRVDAGFAHLSSGRIAGLHGSCEEAK
jgi:hypothetical protein